MINEAPCIFRYLETLHPEPNLLGTDPIESAHIEAWERFGEMQGMQAVGEFFRNQSEVLQNRAMPGFSGIALIPELVERGKQRIAWFYEQIDKRLAQSEYLGAERSPPLISRPNASSILEPQLVWLSRPVAATSNVGTKR